MMGRDRGSKPAPAIAQQLLTPSSYTSGAGLCILHRKLCTIKTLE
jgi:hypothetical protein